MRFQNFVKRISLAALLVPFFSFAQVSPPSQLSRVAGRFVASNYGQWALPIYQFPAGTGSLTFTLNNSTVQLDSLRRIMPFATNAQVYVGTELVTITAVGSGCIVGSSVTGGCRLTATFSDAHTAADYVSSATFGLQEALNDAGESGGGAVTVDSAWAALGGTTDILNAATLPSNTGIEDLRTGVPSSGGGGVTQTCNAATVSNYQQAVCVKTLSSAQILAFDGTDATAISAILTPGAGKIAVLSGSVAGEYLFNTTPYSAELHLDYVYVTGESFPMLQVTTNQTANFIGASLVPGTALDDASANFINSRIGVFATSAITDGDGTVVLTIPYTVIPVS